MAAVNYNFSIEQGSDFEVNFQYNDSNGQSVNLGDTNTSCVVMQIIPNSGDTFGFSTKKIGNTSLFSNDKGLITLKISNALTQSFQFDNAIYDLDVLIGDKITRLVYGNIDIIKRQTPFPSCILSSPSTNTDDTPSTTPTPSESSPDFQNLCLDTDCLNLDIYSIPYQGSGLIINDLSTASSNIITTSTNNIENIEVLINNLNHTSPQDLQIFLAPPSGNKILLAANHKMPKTNFNFMFSNKALPTSYIYNINNGSYCNIYDKTSIVKYSNETLLSNFGHLIGHSVTGVWSLLIKDTDPDPAPIGSGYMDGWKLIVTYQP
jgi:subtilisin-like proprotein convertase family protein